MKQENNNNIAAVNKEVFWSDITAAELRMKWDELLLIAEVREYIVSEREKRKAAAEKKIEEIIPSENEIEDNVQNDSLISDDNMAAKNP